MADAKTAHLDPQKQAELAADMARIADRSRKLVTEFLAKNADAKDKPNLDPLNIGGAFMALTQKMMENPAKLWEAQASLWQDYMNLWQSAATRFLGGEAKPVAEPTAEDRRFKDDTWSENLLFDFIKQSYLLSARWLQSTVQNVEGLDEKSAKKVDFYTKQYVDAMAPS
ncbi:MAG: class I poly(R)-hydroxyalkanoic acid synthase, partial [Alphaproteobacteria bacterium]